MLKKYLALCLGLLVLNLFLTGAAFAQTNEEKDSKFAAKVKANVEKLGTGKEARIEVKLKNGQKLNGFVSQINEDSFVVMNELTTTPTDVPYPQAKQVKGHNLSTGAKIAIAVGIIAGIVIVLALIFKGASGS